MADMRTSKSDRLSDSNAHRTLLQLYEKRVPLVPVTRDGEALTRPMTQAEFGQTFGIGTQGMVWQFLHGKTPLTIEAAARFAKGLNCTIHDISPLLASTLQRDILPVLGRAAAVFLTILTLWIQPQPAAAAISHNASSPTFFAQVVEQITHCVQWLRLRFAFRNKGIRVNPSVRHAIAA